jgi:hypothetical protein
VIESIVGEKGSPGLARLRQNSAGEKVISGSSYWPNAKPQFQP